jgi:hypothetical protein
MIDLTGHLDYCNPELLSEELEAALGYDIKLSITREGGAVTAAAVQNVDGAPFSTEDENLIIVTVQAHDYLVSSTAELAREAIETRKALAKGRLEAVGSDGIRVTGLPDLSDIVADIVEALDLDL